MAWSRPSPRLASSGRLPPCQFPSGAVRTQIASQANGAAYLFIYLFTLRLHFEALNCADFHALLELRFENENENEIGPKPSFSPGIGT